MVELPAVTGLGKWKARGKPRQRKAADGGGLFPLGRKPPLPWEVRSEALAGCRFGTLHKVPLVYLEI